jgi:pimeloyl-ACP methyl ester carboxylesterase
VFPTDLHLVRHHPAIDHPPVVLVHGAPDRSKNFARVLHLLPDVPVTVYDRRGYGKSLNAPLQGRGFEEHAEDLIGILNATPSIVVGQSAGGAIAMMAATLAPELFLSLGVWEPPLTWCDFWPERYVEDTRACVAFSSTRELGEFMNRRMIGDERWESLPERTRDLLQIEGAAFHADMACQLEHVFDIMNIKAPMVVGCGSDGDGPGSAASHQLAKLLGAQLFVGQGADHYAHTNHAEVWVELVRATIARASC